MKGPIPVSIRFKVGESLDPDFLETKIEKYTLSQLPSDNLNDFKGELLLTFEDKWVEGQRGSNPEKEGEIVLSLLSMILRQRLKISACQLNNVDTSYQDKEVILFESPVKITENITELYKKFRSLPLEDLLERFLRACEAYQEALLISKSNPTISFFLFVVSIECLSNKNLDFYKYLMKESPSKENFSKKEINKFYNNFTQEYGLKNNFIQFIITNYEEWKTTFSEEEFRKLLASIYKIRSFFTHEGKNLEKYIKFVDITLRSKSFFTNIDDQDLEFPGLNYLSRLVRSVLINFLKGQKDTEKDNIPALALKESIINMVLNKPREEIKNGTFLTTNKIKYRT